MKGARARQRKSLYARSEYARLTRVLLSNATESRNGSRGFGATQSTKCASWVALWKQDDKTMGSGSANFPKLGPPARLQLEKELPR
ncbi:hypothetical protein NDU88_000071 [Pleurodeles waltl]|uniref:Uncharacterized protein n=1 Tax=Pleurodeles waltl TaxID=8319 RepID=A0AAV7V4P7_PLEWA|nr:hypothetical protein NDU88_000071 [Pleurodeles waltl]